MWLKEIFITHHVLWYIKKLTAGYKKTKKNGADEWAGGGDGDGYKECR